MDDHVCGHHLDGNHLEVPIEIHHLRPHLCRWGSITQVRQVEFKAFGHPHTCFGPSSTIPVFASSWCLEPEKVCIKWHDLVVDPHSNTSFLRRGLLGEKDTR